MSESQATIEVRGACPHDCPDTCSLKVTVKDGVAVKVAGNPDHPPTHGALCTKVSRYTERSYDPGRVLTPLKRVGPKGARQFIPVTWDEALADIATRLNAIAARDPAAARRAARTHLVHSARRLERGKLKCIVSSTAVPGFAHDGSIVQLGTFPTPAMGRKPAPYDAFSVPVRSLVSTWMIARARAVGERGLAMAPSMPAAT